jgi:predicted RNA-binding protein YlqC (UPF0109 family)
VSEHGTRAQAVVEHVVRSLATVPEAVRVDAEEGGGEVVLSIHADQSDMGRIIGKRGRVIQAVRQVARAAGALDDVRTSVDVVE